MAFSNPIRMSVWSDRSWASSTTITCAHPLKLFIYHLRWLLTQSIHKSHTSCNSLAIDQGLNPTPNKSSVRLGAITKKVTYSSGCSWERLTSARGHSCFMLKAHSYEASNSRCSLVLTTVAHLVSPQIRILQSFLNQHSICQVLDHCFTTGLFIKSNRIPHLKRHIYGVSNQAVSTDPNCTHVTHNTPMRILLGPSLAHGVWENRAFVQNIMSIDAHAQKATHSAPDTEVVFRA